MSTRENIRLIARASLLFYAHSLDKLTRLNQRHLFFANYIWYFTFTRLLDVWYPLVCDNPLIKRSHTGDKTLQNVLTPYMQKTLNHAQIQKIPSGVGEVPENFSITRMKYPGINARQTGVVRLVLG